MTQVTSSKTNAVATPARDLKNLLAQESIQKRFKEILGEKSAGFISSVINVVNGNNALAQAEPNSIIMSAAVAATLDLPINPNLGFAYIIAYKQNYQEDGQWKSKQVAQFQMGYKGFIQLAMRTGQYKRINVTEVRAGQLKKANPLTEEYEFDFDVEGGEIIGFVAYFKMLNGFEKMVYWNVAKINDHAKRYSKSFSQKNSPWTTNYTEMAQKTLIKHVLSKYGVLSIEMQKAGHVDQALVKDFEGNVVEHIDNVDHIDITNQPAISETSESIDDEKETMKVEVPSSEDL